MTSIFRPSPNITRGPTQHSGSSHQFTGSVAITGSLTVNGTPITGGGGGGGGDVTGPGSSTNNAITRFNGATGKIIKNSGVTIDNSNNMQGVTTLSAIDVSASSNISASAFYGDVSTLTPPGLGGSLLYNDGAGGIAGGTDLVFNGGLPGLQATNVDVLNSLTTTTLTASAHLSSSVLYATTITGSLTSLGIATATTLTASSHISSSIFYGSSATLETITTTGNITFGDSTSDFHQISGTLSISGSEPLKVFGPTGVHVGGPTIITRNTASFGDDWQQPMSGALIVSDNVSGDEAVMYVHSQDNVATIGFKNSETLVPGLGNKQSNYIFNASQRGVWIGLQDDVLQLQNNIGDTIIRAGGLNEVIVGRTGTTIGNEVTDAHKVTGSLSVSGSTTLRASTVMGELSTDVHQVTGTLSVSGSTILSGSNTFGQLSSDVHQVTGTLNHLGSSSHTGDTIQVGNYQLTGALGLLGDMTHPGNTTQDGDYTLTGSFKHLGDTIQVGDIIHNGAYTLTGTFSHLGDVSHDGNTIQTGNYQLTGTLNHLGDVSHIGAFDQTGNKIQVGDYTLSGTFNHTGSTNHIGDVTQTGNYQLTGTLNHLGDVSHIGNTAQTGDYQLTGTLNHLGDADQVGNYEISGTLTVNGPLELQGGLQFGSSFASATLSSNTNNLVIPGLAGSILVRLTASPSNYELTGIEVPDSTKTYFFSIFNVGTRSITFKNDDAASTAENRFLLGGNVVVQTGEGITLIYDPVDTRWRSPGKNI